MKLKCTHLYEIVIEGCVHLKSTVLPRFYCKWINALAREKRIYLEKNEAVNELPGPTAD